MIQINGTSCSTGSESVSYIAISYSIPFPASAFENSLSEDDRKKLDFSLERHKEGLKLLSQ
jgi:hypothetical protein